MIFFCEPSDTLGISQTEFAISVLECLTRYNSIPTCDLNLVWSLDEIKISLFWDIECLSLVLLVFFMFSFWLPMVQTVPLDS
jgi:hypothetical protein